VVYNLRETIDEIQIVFKDLLFLGFALVNDICLGFFLSILPLV